jgi:hypothetical protein
VAERNRLQPGESVAAAGAAAARRQLVPDEPATAVGQNGWATDQALQVLLVVVGRGTSAPASVWGHAAADCGAADAIGLALPLRLQNLEPKEEGRHSVGEIDYAATSGALQMGKERAVGTPKPRLGCCGHTFLDPRDEGELGYASLESKSEILAHYL